ncbi:MAG: BatD family protein [Xanthomonadaceae bacterium]|jgi:hypothetical protein|nr:BatD family protein [Xanthomonadaceae bacterium]
MNENGLSTQIVQSAFTRRIVGCWLWIVVVLSSISSNAPATTRAWLDRTQIAQGQVVTLNIETDQVHAVPDYTPLHQEFKISNPQRRQEFSIINGEVSKRVRFGLALAPERMGELTIPALKVGNEYTQPLALTVIAGSQTQSSDQDVFLEMEVDQSRPYVQQNVGVILRLYYAVPIVSGQLDLAAPDGAALQRIGNDLQSSRVINERRYNVVERRFLLVPERSGELQLPAPQFSGQLSQGIYDHFLGGTSELHAVGRSVTLQVRPLPDDAVQPWLPLRNLSLRYVSLPKQFRVGEATMVEVEVIAQGATKPQFPSWPEYSIPGAQVFAEPIEYSESFVDGLPHLRMRRRYSIVPSRAGDLSVPGMHIDWWNTTTSEASVAALPAITLTVAAGDAATVSVPGDVSATVDTDGVDMSSTASATTDRAEVRVERLPWKELTMAMACLWLVSLGAFFYWQYRRRRSLPSAAMPDDLPDSTGRKLTVTELRHILDTGDLQEVGHVLLHMTSPVLPDMDALIEHLGDHRQREAVVQLQQACWGAGVDAATARSALRAAFREGPRWRTVPAIEEIQILPPLYPQRRSDS